MQMLNVNIIPSISQLFWAEVNYFFLSLFSIAFAIRSAPQKIAQVRMEIQMQSASIISSISLGPKIDGLDVFNMSANDALPFIPSAGGIFVRSEDVRMWFAINMLLTFRTEFWFIYFLKNRSDAVVFWYLFKEFHRAEKIYLKIPVQTSTRVAIKSVIWAFTKRLFLVLMSPKRD